MENKRKAHQIANCELCQRIFNRPEPVDICQVCEEYLNSHGWHFISNDNINFNKCVEALHQKMWDEFRKARPDLNLPKTVEFKKMKSIIIRAKQSDLSAAELKMKFTDPKLGEPWPEETIDGS